MFDFTFNITYVIQSKTCRIFRNRKGNIKRYKYTFSQSTIKHQYLENVLKSSRSVAKTMPRSSSIVR